MTEADAVVQIAGEDLAITWRTLMSVARNYDMGSVGEASLIEARRLVEIEVRIQYGDDAWTTMCASGEGAAPTRKD